MCHEARKGSYAGSRWSKPGAPPLHSTNLQAPQIWKSRFRMVPLIAAFVLLQVVLFFLLFLYFKKR
jgi:hypothetical protein